MNNVIQAFLFTLIAGLSTGIGSLIAFFAKKANKGFLALSLGFSGGVMVYISLVEIFPKAVEELSIGGDEKLGTIYTVIGFFLGILLIAIIDKMIPSEENPHEIKELTKEDILIVKEAQVEGENKLNENVKEVENPAVGEDYSSKKMLRTGVFTALAIAIHNFPEGLATFMTALKDPTLALPIVGAIALHNIPEGISVSVPLYYATGSRKKAFIYSLLSGFSEPLGALVGYLILLPIMTPVVQGMVFAATAGIMVFISVDELLPSAREYGEHHLSIYGFVAGMLLMAISLILFM